MSAAPNGAASHTPSPAAPLPTSHDDDDTSPSAPSLFLQKIIGQPVTVRLTSGVDYRGTLSCLDGYMNIAMEDTEEVVKGESRGKFGDAFVRGNNVLYIEAGKS